MSDTSGKPPGREIGKITVDEQGRVIIDDPEFAKRVQDAVVNAALASAVINMHCPPPTPSNTGIVCALNSLTLCGAQ